MTKIKLLLAGKREIFCEGLVKLLECEPDMEVVCVCRTGLGVVERANEHQPDAILIDTELPECSGIETIQRIHERLPNTNIIVLTHSEVDTDLISAIKAGARAYISKDTISIENLIKTITLVAAGEVIVSPPMASRLLAEINLLGEDKGAAKAGGASLSKREQAVLSLVAQGFTNREIATSLFISEHTVKVHLRNIMGKFHAHTRQQAVALGREKAAI